MMYGNWGYGSGFGWIFMVIFWGLIIWGIIALIHRFNHDGHSGCCGGDNGGQKNMPSGKNSALDILDERYAKGEINKEEYEAKKKDLKE
ncbi:MAG: SHOCT domain-containing protein [Candidatus Moranbacteria bacterium]|nr:SHOCT domain-containing protein [bacterium]MDZ4385218.1 SHOCT domain-containing protein [Candidatus Moranbacteria bacterium]